MEFIVYDTSMFDFSEFGGLKFRIMPSSYSYSCGFLYSAVCIEYAIFITYKNEKDFDKELNDEITFCYNFYGNKPDEELCPDAIHAKQFYIECFTEWKK